MNIHLDFGVLRILASICGVLLILNVMVGGFSIRAFSAAGLPFDVYLSWRFFAAFRLAARSTGGDAT